MEYRAAGQDKGYLNSISDSTASDPHAAWCVAHLAKGRQTLAPPIEHRWRLLWLVPCHWGTRTTLRRGGKGTAAQRTPVSPRILTRGHACTEKKRGWDRWRWCVHSGVLQVRCAVIEIVRRHHDWSRNKALVWPYPVRWDPVGVHGEYGPVETEIRGWNLEQQLWRIWNLCLFAPTVL